VFVVNDNFKRAIGTLCLILALSGPLAAKAASVKVGDAFPEVDSFQFEGNLHGKVVLVDF
jgi:hypothetical protein